MHFHPSPASFPGREAANGALAALAKYPAHAVHGVALVDGELVAFGGACEYPDVSSLVDSLGQDSDAHVYERDELRMFPVGRRGGDDSPEVQRRGERVGGVTVGSRTARALKLHLEGMSVEDAADEVGINPSAVYRAKQRAAARAKACATCGRDF